MKKWLIGGGILAAIIVTYFLLRKKKPAVKEIPGGQFTPKILTAEDWAQLEKVFSAGNPYQNELALSIEGQAESENSPTTYAGKQKTIVTKEQFNNLVLALIRQHIGTKSGWIQEEENRRFESWSGAARAGYADTLARAWAYVARVYVAGNNYYTPPAGTATGSTATGSTLTAAQAAIKATGTAENYYSLNWQPTNTPNIYKLTVTNENGTTTSYFSIISKTIVSLHTAKSQAYDGR